VLRLLPGSAVGQSVLAHGAAAALLLGWVHLGKSLPPVVAELDLSMMPMTAPNRGGGYAKPAPKWTLPKAGKAPAPAPAPAAPEPEAAASAPAGAPAGTGGGGDATGRGDYVPASQTARKPRWLSNFITSRDYPSVARQQGKDGRVLLYIVIDAEGRVRDAKLLEGSYPVFNEVALRKIQEAVFSPAYDASGKPVACRATIPIRFELR